MFVCILFLCQNVCAQTVFNAGSYNDYTVLDCFKNSQYKSNFKADTIKSNYVLKGQKIWRIIQLDNQENNQLFNNTSKCKQVGLFEIIKFGLFNKKLKAFSTDNFNGVANHLMPEEKLLLAIKIKDSVTTSVFDANGNESIETIKTNRYLYSKDITSFLLKENWITNSYTGKLEKVIIGIAPLCLDKKTGNTLPLFWLYYPEWKELFSSFEAKNFYSDASISFNDVLNKKLFISLISKEDNLFDRSVKSVNKGRDFYIESESIKEKIMNYEEDLFQH